MRYIAILFLFLSTSSAYAQNFTGMNLLRACRIAVESPKNADVGTYMEAARCLGYIDGFMDTNAIVTAMSKGKTKLFCAPPEGIGLEQGARIAVKYFTENPENLHLPARMQLMVAFMAAFPCQ